MINSISPYRKVLSALLAVWMGIIVISGIVFMHKEVTSDGEIITHIHPYDFTQKDKDHHKSDAEIRYLDVIYQGSFVESDFATFEVPFFQVFFLEYKQVLQGKYYFDKLVSTYLRGPPSIV